MLRRDHRVVAADTRGHAGGSGNNPMIAAARGAPLGASTGRSRAPGPGLGRGEQADDRGGVADVAVEDPLDGVGQRHPLDGHVRLLVLDDEPVGPVDVGEALGQVDQHQLVAESRGCCTWWSAATSGSAASCASSASSRFAVSSGGSPSASRSPAGSSHRCRRPGAGTAAAGRRGRRRRARRRRPPRVVDHLADAVAAAGHRDGVAAQGDDAPLVDRLAVEHPVLVRRPAPTHSDADLLAPRRHRHRQPRRLLVVDGRLHERRGTAGAAGWAGSSARGGPACRRRTGAPRGAARRTRPAARRARCRRTPGPASLSRSR